VNSSAYISVKYFSDFYISYRRGIGVEPERMISKLSGAYFDHNHTKEFLCLYMDII
jgi:hypothetical protein